MLSLPCPQFLSLIASARTSAAAAERALGATNRLSPEDKGQQGQLLLGALDPAFFGITAPPQEAATQLQVGWLMLLLAHLLPSCACGHGPCPIPSGSPTLTCCCHLKPHPPFFPQLQLASLLAELLAKGDSSLPLGTLPVLEALTLGEPQAFSPATRAYVACLEQRALGTAFAFNLTREGRPVCSLMLVDACLLACSLGVPQPPLPFRPCTPAQAMG